MPMKESSLEKKLRALYRTYLDAIVAGDADAASALIDDAIASALPIDRMYVDIVCAAQRQLGELWEKKTICITEEHVATQISFSQLAKLRRAMKPKAPLGRTVLVAVPFGETHIMAAQVVADFLYFEGWKVSFSGLSSPHDDLVAFVRKNKFDLVCFSISVEPDKDFSGVLEQLKGLPRAPRILLGGAAAGQFAASSAVDGVAKSISGAVETARELFAEQPPRHSLPQLLRDLGQKIAIARKELKMNQQQLAEACGMDRAYLSLVENGRQNISIAAVYKIAAALRVPPRNLL